MKICIWRYKESTRNYSGYHLSADKEGCQTLRKKLNQIQTSTVVSLSAPDAKVLSVPNKQGGRAKVVSGQKLRFHTDDTLIHNCFRWEEDGSTWHLTCSREMIAKLIQGIDDIERGEGDYAIGDERGQNLWFWWWPR